MKTLTTKCIILGHKNFGEADKLIFFYSKELGKIKAIAKGARKLTSKFIGHLETLNFCVASFYFGPKNIILREVVTEKNFLKTRDNFSEIENALKIAEITNQALFENQTLDDLHELLEKTLHHLNLSTKCSLIKSAYTVKLLDKSGRIPDFKDTPLQMEQKYLKFFNFVKERPLHEIEKITLNHEEEQEVERVINNFLYA